MEQKGILMAAGMFLLVLLPLFRNTLSQRKQYVQICGDTANHDPSLREFWFFSYQSSAQLIAVLEVPGTFGEYAYTFEREGMCLTFHHRLTGYTARCILFLEPRENGTRIRLCWTQGRLDAPKAGTKLLFLENLFCHEVLMAEPIPYHSEKP